MRTGAGDAACSGPRQGSDYVLGVEHLNPWIVMYVTAIVVHDRSVDVSGAVLTFRGVATWHGAQDHV
jgi:hypothetical protein